MKESAAETLIGAGVLAVAGFFLVYAAQTADIRAGGTGYEVVAKFRKAEGINVGGDVRIAGVKVGSIASMGLDPKTYTAEVHMTVDPGISIPEDSLAKISSSGLLGDAFVAIDPGSSDLMLEPGGELTYTQGSVSLIEILAKVMQGGETK